MKKLITILLCVTIVLVLGGCGDSNKPTNPFTDVLSTEDTSKLLKDNNFKTEIKYLGVQTGTIVTITNDKDNEFKIQYSDRSSIVTINGEMNFFYKDDINKAINFSISDKGTVKIGNCSILLDTEEENYEEDSNKCTDSLITDAKEMKKKLSDFLIKYKLDLLHLRVYCNKYLDKNFDNAKVKAKEQEKNEEEAHKKNVQEDKKKNAELYKEFKKTFIDSCDTYGYKDIFRNAEDYQGKNAKFTGKVVQVINDTLETDLRVNVTRDKLGFYDDTIYVVWKNYDREHDPVTINRILKDDIVTMYGTLNGIQTYETTSGSSVTIPKFDAQYIELVK